jgi:hypothetical protein
MNAKMIVSVHAPEDGRVKQKHVVENMGKANTRIKERCI